jgi:hypothetical protein
MRLQAQTLYDVWELTHFVNESQFHELVHGLFGPSNDPGVLELDLPSGDKEFEAGLMGEAPYGHPGLRRNQ